MIERKINKSKIMNKSRKITLGLYVTIELE